MARVGLYRAFMMLMLSFFANGAIAKEWYFQPKARVYSEYDTNPQLRSINVQDAFGLINNLGATYGLRSDLYHISSTTLVDIYSYWGSPNLNLDRQNFYTDLNANYFLTERNELGLSTVYRRDTSLTSEIRSSGLIQNQVPRESITVTPTWSFSLSEFKRIKTNYSHENVTYDLNKYGLRSYDTDSGSVSFLDQWTPSLQYFISFGALHYNSPSISNLNDTTINNYSLNVGFEHKYSETLKFNASVGARSTETEIKPLASVNSLGWLLSVGLNKQFEIGNLNLNYARSVSPTGIGLFLQSDAFDATAEYKFSERFKAILSASVIITSSTDTTNNSYDRTYYMVEPKLSWDFTRRASLVGGYRYRWQQYDQSNSVLGTLATSNAVFLNVNYQWDKFASNKDSHFLRALLTNIEAVTFVKPKAEVSDFSNQDFLISGFFTELKRNNNLRNYSARFRNALFFHYEKYVGKNI